MSIYRGIPSRSSEVLPVSVRDVLASLRVSESLGKPEVDNVHVVLLLADTNQEVVWLDISVQEVS